MIELATVKNNELKKNRDSDDNNRVLACEISSPDDVQSIELANISGEDTNPLPEDFVLVISISEAYKMGILVDDGIAPAQDLESGEKELYSRSDATTKAAKLRLRKNGDLRFNDGIDYAVKFNELQISFNELQAKFNAHVHNALGAPTATPSVADISTSKVEKVRL